MKVSSAFKVEKNDINIFLRSYILAQKIFSDLNEESWAQILYNKSAYKTKIYFITKNNIDKGFAVFSYFQFNDEDKSKVLRAAVGILPEARGENTINPIIARENLLFYFTNLFQKKYFSSVFVGPIMYHLATGTLYESYPSVFNKNGDKYQHILKTCIENFGYKSQSSHHSVVSTNFKVDFSEKEIEEILNSKKETLIFYCKINPNFRNGDGVVLIVPHNFKNAWHSTLNLFSKNKKHLY